MKQVPTDPMPHARREDLVIKEVAGETLVYDCKTHRAHCLNPVAAFVWSRCDGRSSMAGVEGVLHERFGAPQGDDLAARALRELGAAGLLAETPVPAPAGRAVSRRDMLKALGAAAACAPLVVSILSPTPAQAASLLGTGAACTDSAQCSSGICQDNTCL